MGFRQLEWLIRSRVAAGLDTVRSDRAYLDEMFTDLSQTTRDQLVVWLAETEVAFQLAWPRSAPDLPLWVMLMLGEAPTYKTIGNIMDPVLGADNTTKNEIQGEYVRKGYQILTITDHPDKTIALSTILQHILKSMVNDLTNLGFYEIQTAQTDLIDQKLDWMPVFGFARATTLSTLVEDTFVYIDTQATKVALGKPDAITADGFINVDFNR